MFTARLGVRALVLGGLAALMLAALGAQSAWAEAATTCVKATKVLTPKKHYTGGFSDKGCTSVNGTHEGKYEKLASFTASEEAQLKALLKYVKVQASGVDSKPTVQFSGANVQVVNGEGKTNTTNGEGNLVVGYDESAYPQTGSHNIVAGEHDEYTSYGGLVVAFESGLTAPFGVVFGAHNGTRAEYATVTGGEQNTASGQGASVSGGAKNTASGPFSSVGGGELNTASGGYSSVGGGQNNTASSFFGSVSGGGKNAATGLRASVGGGEANNAEGAQGGWIGGGYKNEVFFKGIGPEAGERAAIFGGKENKTAVNYAAIP
jgi:hypothetical protein